MIRYSVAQHIPSGCIYLIIADFTNATMGYVEVEQRDVYSENTGYHLAAYPENFGPVENSLEDAAWIAAQKWHILVPEQENESGS